MMRPPSNNDKNGKILSANHRPRASSSLLSRVRDVDKTTDNDNAISSNHSIGSSSGRQPWRRRHSRSGSRSENWNDDEDNNDKDAIIITKHPSAGDVWEDIQPRQQQQSLNDGRESTTTSNNNNKSSLGKGILRFFGGMGRNRNSNSNNDSSHGSSNQNKQDDADAFDLSVFDVRSSWQASTPSKEYQPVVSNQPSDHSFVSEMTNPTYFVAANMKKQEMQSSKKKRGDSLEDFDPSTFASAADPFDRTLPMVESDELSDPFFPHLSNESFPSVASEEITGGTDDNNKEADSVFQVDKSRRFRTMQAVVPRTAIGKHRSKTCVNNSLEIKPRVTTSSPLLVNQKSASEQRAVALIKREHLFSSQHSMSTSSVIMRGVSPVMAQNPGKQQQPKEQTTSKTVYTACQGGIPQPVHLTSSRRSGVMSMSTIPVESVSIQLTSVDSGVSSQSKSTMRKNGSKPLPGCSLSRDSFDTVYSTFDESLITDPLQRAGLRLLHQAVIPIQTAARRHLALREALTRLWGIVIIQSTVRRFLVQREYLSQLDSSIAIQALWRGCSVRDNILLKQCCAIEIQRFVRGYQATVKVYADIFRVTVVQSIARRKRAIEEAMARMTFVVQTQSIARGFLVRFRLRQMQSAALCIQSLFRFHVSRKELAILKAVVKIQSQLRRYLCYVPCKEYLAARRIQTQSRRYTARRVYKMYVAARMVQAQWRMYTCSKSYLEYIAAMIVQTQWRGYRASQMYKRERAVVKIQSNWRAFHCSRQFLRCIAATIIQAQYRGYLTRVKKHKLHAAINIQRCWRGYTIYSDFLFTISDIVASQSVARRMIATRTYNKMRVISKNHAARVIQRFSRGVLVKKALAAVRIQASWRGFAVHAQYLIAMYENAAATIIQSTWRRFWCNVSFLIGVHSAITIQSVYRGHLERASYIEKLCAVQTTQGYFQRFLARKNERQDELIKVITTEAADEGASSVEYMERASTLSVQKVFRGYMARNALDRYFAARDIQTAWRCFIARAYYLDYRIHLSALRIQCLWRQSRARTSFLALRQVLMADDIKAAVFVQKVWRGKFSRSVTGTFDAWQRRMFVEDPAAVSIQKIWRGFREVLHFWHACGSVIQIQSAMRGWLARLQRTKENDSVVVLQSYIRRWQARMRLSEGLGSVILLQSTVRGMLARKELNERRFILQFIRTASGAQRSNTPVRTRLPHLHAPPRSSSLNCRRQNASPFVQRRRGEQSSSFTDKNLDQRQTIPRSLKSSQASIVQNKVAKERDEAARRIQRFFLMVKMEVDREIMRAREKKRRKKRKPKNHKLIDDENEVLDDVWTKTVLNNKNSEPETIHDIQKSAARDLMARLARPMQDQNGASPGVYGDSVARAGKSSLKVAPSRLATLSQPEMELDYLLEQAWIDTEIRKVKERRRQQQGKHSKKFHRSESPSSRKVISSALP